MAQEKEKGLGHQIQGQAIKVSLKLIFFKQHKLLNQIVTLTLIQSSSQNPCPMTTDRGGCTMFTHMICYLKQIFTKFPQTIPHHTSFQIFSGKCTEEMTPKQLVVCGYTLRVYNPTIAFHWQKNVYVTINSQNVQLAEVEEGYLGF